MAGLTSTDEETATIYALNKINKWKFDTQTLFQQPEHIKWVSRKWETFCPPGLTCELGNVEFTKDGCNKISCFPYNSFGYKTNQLDKPDCFLSGSKDILPFVEWIDDTCRLSNSYLKLWAEFPRVRREGEVKGVTDAPPFVYDNTRLPYPIIIPRNYCEDYMKISFDSETESCYVSDDQYVAELFLGSLYREIKQ